jgi:hypothetical protein
MCCAEIEPAMTFPASPAMSGKSGESYDTLMTYLG